MISTICFCRTFTAFPSPKPPVVLINPPLFHSAENQAEGGHTSVR